jgi:DNA-binding LytR/AlgR family response regulator
MEITKCIAIDDEPLALEKITGFINRLPQLKLEASFESCTAAASYILGHSDYLVFLDIQMKDMTGIQLLESLPVKPSVILTTAHSEFALKGYELNVIDYLLKPYSFERFSQAVFKATSKPNVVIKEEESAEYIFVKSDYRILKVLTDDIFYIEGMRDYWCLVTRKGKILTSLTYSELENLIPKNTFVRTHRSFIVNLKHIESIERHRIKIQGNLIPISDSFREIFYNQLKLGNKV